MSQVLLGPDGKPFGAEFRKVAPPSPGKGFGNWAGRGDVQYLDLPGGGLMQFDLSRLTLADFRSMRDHYQVNSSLAVLTFMLHQIDWKIECDNERARKICQDNMEEIWTRLIRAMSQSFWAGYSPNVLEWENDTPSRRVVLGKIKDLVPEECSVNWKKVPGGMPEGLHPDATPPQIKVFDGIKQVGMPGYIGTQNSYWYPLLMENGNYGGRKLLKAAFQPWFFSILMHLFANRYYERFGEPVPVGRAPYDENIDVNGQNVRGNDLMGMLVQQIRNRSAVVLPSDRSVVGTETEFDYTLEYLESQMRGADFERYMTRLDEEISLGLFTPILLMRTADVGSYNLGVGHMQVYMQMLNAIAGDMKEYIDRYILSPMVDYNVSTTTPRARIKFRKLGAAQQETLRAVLIQLMSNGGVKVDVGELGQAIGLSLTEVEEVTEPTPAPQVDDRIDRQRDDGDPTVVDSITQRVSGQVRKAFRAGEFNSQFNPSVGYDRQVTADLAKRGVPDAQGAARTYLRAVERAIAETASASDLFSSADDAVTIISGIIRSTYPDAENVGAH